MCSENWCPPCGMQRREDQPCWPQHVLDPQVFGEAVAQGGVDLDEVAVRAHPAVADQVPGVLQGEQVLAGRDRAPVVLGHGRVQSRSPAGRRSPRTRTGRTARWPCRTPARRQVEPAVDVDREAGPVTVEDVEDGFDALEVLSEVGAADLHLHHPVAHGRGTGASRPAARAGVLPGRSSRRRRRRTPSRRAAVAVLVGEEPVQRLPGDLGRQVEQRHVDHADRDRAFPVAAGLLVVHQEVPRLGGVESWPSSFRRSSAGASSRRGMMRRRRMLAGGVAAVRVEPVPDKGFAVDDHVADDRDDRAVHRAEVDPGVPDRRADGDDALVDGHDFHL